jgi:hypothetical protein
LRLDSREALLKGGDSGPAIISGKPDESLLVKALTYQADPRMPPKGKLPEGEIAQVREWVRRGLPWPAAQDAPVVKASKGFVTDEHRRWWAYQPLRPVSPPDCPKNASFARSPIDRFILAGLQAKDLAPALPADKRTLIRRATFDLIGLPPTPEEIETFLADDQPDAFPRVVDRLLASPHYGERWGRHFLDVVRYADYYQKDPKSHPLNASFELHEAYRYRDWVVSAFNRDQPYDQFVMHQIAGDLLSGPKGESPYVDGLVATGFLSIGSWDHGDADKDKIVSDIVDDQIDVVGKAFLGLTLSCARCHDHKFDPVSTDDYYALAGIFYSTRTLAELGAKGAHSILNRLPLVPPEYLKKRDSQLAALKQIDERLRVAGARHFAAMVVAPTPLGMAHVAWHDDETRVLTLRRDQVSKELLPAPPLALAVQEGGTPGSLFPGVQDVNLHIRGSYTRLGPVVPRRMPQFFTGTTLADLKGSGRLELAKWVASPNNPLTARVMVNRVWQHHFGEGIVRTPNNFGKLGELPSHSELLDWLAVQFIQDGWSVKKLHRRIMLSAVYQQGGLVPREVAAKDPDNRLFGRMTPQRLEAEAIRDAMLAASGQLDPTPGGPATVDLTTPRRSLYIATTRWDRSNYSTLFDAANPDQPVEKRTTSTVAPQALFLLNNPFAHTQAKHLAARLKSAAKDDDSRIRLAYQLLYARLPTNEEVRLGHQFLAASNWDEYAHALFCGNEFVYLD